ncbi:MAG: immunity 17 family protein [Prevotellaceae bacterium]|jgi:hypothetical protein|nr:immunity 17 family protein [Prevotellaceae bacterium]
MDKYIAIAILAASGILALLASLFNWNWFFNTGNIRAWAGRLGRLRTRWIYGVLGALLILTAIMVLLTATSLSVSPPR